jgi:integrase
MTALICLSVSCYPVDTMRTHQGLFRVGKSEIGNGNKKWFIVGRPNGKRQRAWFKTKEQAEAEAEERNHKIRQFGESVVSVDPALLSEATEVQTLLKSYGKTIRDAGAFYLAHLKRVNASCSVNELVDRVLAEYTRRLEAGEIGQHRSVDMRSTLKRFQAHFGDANMATLTGGQIKDWLAGMDELTPRTRNNRMVDLHAAFVTAKTWNLIAENPLADIPKFNVSKPPKIGILTPQQLSAFLNVVDTKFIPFFTINAFTGLRRAEVERLDWSEIKLDRRLIDLPPAKSKNKRRKLVDIPENLAAWLTPQAKTEGSIMPRAKVQVAMANAVEKAGIKWPHNCLRHSFCSHAVALHGFTWTRLQADHSERVLRDHYREVVTKFEADAYFAVHA